MNIDEAIKNLNDIRRFIIPYARLKDQNALQLGIEALKRIQDFHEDDELLPGETK